MDWSSFGINAGIEQGLSMIDGIGTIANGKYDYSGEDLRLEDAVAAGSERGSAIGNMFGPLGKMIGGAIGANKARKTASEIITNRENRMEQMLQMQRDKQKEMSLFKSNDINQINEQEWEV